MIKKMPRVIKKLGKEAALSDLYEGRPTKQHTF